MEVHGEVHGVRAHFVIKLIKCEQTFIALAAIGRSNVQIDNDLLFNNLRIVRPL